VIELLKSDTFWSALGALATLAGVGAILYAAKQLRFDAWVKAQDIWVSEGFTTARREVFARLDNLQAPWSAEEKTKGLNVCRRIDEFVRLAPYLGKRKMLAIWGDPLAKAWLVLEPLVTEERSTTSWPTKWDAFEKFGRKALAMNPQVRAKQCPAQRPN
jgi:hypothetical protein